MSSTRTNKKPQNLSLSQILLNLVQIYKSHAKLTPSEFIEGQLALQYVTDKIGSSFMQLHRHKLFLGSVGNLFTSFMNSDKANQINIRLNSDEVLVILYLLIFELTTENSKEIHTSFGKNSIVLKRFISFMSSEDYLLKIIENGSKFYEREYLLENILYRLLQNQITLQNLEEIDIKDKSSTTTRKVLTKPVGPTMLDKPKKVVLKKDETLEVYEPFKSRAVPKTTYETFDPETFMSAARSANQKAAYELLAQARRLQFRCAEPKPPSKPLSPLPRPQPIIAKPPPKFDPVEVKGTTTSLMRQAALITKEKMAEIKEIQQLVNGATIDPFDSRLLEEIRLAKEEEYLQDIERKHLQGLLTREEAILAKKRYFQRNQAKKQEYQEERIKLLETIDQYRRKEEEKTKLLVEKAQAIEKGAKDAEAKLLKERRCNAKIVGYETQILLKQAYEEREEELTKKIQLIKELRLLQQINAGSNKVEFDPTETGNLGLLCEMSIAELQERLALLKVTMQEELDERKAKILAERKKQQIMLEEMKEFVETAKGQKCKAVVSKDLKKENSHLNKPIPKDIQILREKLKIAREQRVNGSSSTSLY